MKILGPNREDSGQPGKKGGEGLGRAPLILSLCTLGGRGESRGRSPAPVGSLCSCVVLLLMERVGGILLYFSTSFLGLSLEGA